MDRGPVRRILLGLWVLGVSLGQPGGSDEVYNVDKRKVSFDMAEKECSRGGHLAELSTDQEANGVLQQVEFELGWGGFHGASTDPQAFWVGLRKTKAQCVDPHLPLRGFRWLSDGGEGWAGAERWWAEPQQTCTTGLCVALQAQANTSRLTRWGLLAKTCKLDLPFICKRPREPKSTKTPLVITTPNLTPSALTPTPTPGPEPEAKPKPQAEEELGPELGLGSKPCPKPHIPVNRWLVMDSKQITVTCWSGAVLILKCFDGRWKMNGSVLDPDTICSESQPMSPPPTGDSNVVEEGTWASLMVPVLVAVAVLVLLVVVVVVVVVVVRCCLVRRSKDRAVRKAEKMAMENKEAGSKDSMETTNEKERR
ncbi:hypothetical protein NHX12_019542 [Muraenolepis orangiensis]|uniref:C-type lectin domain-containing protein n=1 Tax=Muraenolepis orangiensis TaxID=630683 RepID=A0A9Q0EYT9_9TELE|nr:hypothetical protein NHX12_019542 [Muraenolepis orangiensis]